MRGPSDHACEATGCIAPCEVWLVDADGTRWRLSPERIDAMGGSLVCRARRRRDGRAQSAYGRALEADPRPVHRLPAQGDELETLSAAGSQSSVDDIHIIVPEVLAELLPTLRARARRERLRREPRHGGANGAANEDGRDGDDDALLGAGHARRYQRSAANVNARSASAMEQAKQRRADRVESVDELPIELADVSERLRDFECRTPTHRRSSRALADPDPDAVADADADPDPDAVADPDADPDPTRTRMRSRMLMRIRTPMRSRTPMRTPSLPPPPSPPNSPAAARPTHHATANSLSEPTPRTYCSNSVEAAGVEPASERPSR